MKKIITTFLLFIIVLSCKKTDNPVIIPPKNKVEIASFVKTDPDFPIASEPVTVYFNLNKGNKAFKGSSSWVYAHTGVLTTESSNASEWYYVKNDWNQVPSLDTKLEQVNDSVYKIKFIPSVFYSVADYSKITHLAFVLRNVDGSIVARNADASDIIIPIYLQNKLSSKLITEDSEPKLNVGSVYSKPLGHKVKINALASKNADLKLTVNQKEIKSLNSKSLSIDFEFIEPGIYNFEFIASIGSEQSVSTISYLIDGDVKIKELPIGVSNGITIKDNKVYFMLTAPQKKSVYLIGDFNQYKILPEYAMNKTPDGNNWWIELDNLDISKDYSYQFLVDGNLKIADPYSQLILDPYNDSYIPTINYSNIPSYPKAKTDGIVSYTQFTTPSYQWSISNFNRPNKQNLVIYEVLLRDFLERNNFKTLSDTISYFKKLGVNCIELMPVNEFEGNISWGYNPSFYFAPDKYYGSKNTLKQFIDKCHQNNIAVVIDMVLNHSFGQSPMVQLYWDNDRERPSESNPWFNPLPKHAYNVGYDINHESSFTKKFVKDIIRFWLTEYKVDGFRFDLSKGFTQKMTDPNVDEWGKKDETRIAIWKEYNHYIKSISSDAYIILEHFAADEEEVELAAAGMLLWNNLNREFSEMIQGKSTNLERLLYNKHAGSSNPHWINYMESHDEERVMYNTLNYGLSDGNYDCKKLETALQRIEMSAAIITLVSGPIMVWQFEEFGYDVSINDGGRLGQKPLKWFYLNDPNRKKLQTNFSKILKLKSQTQLTNTNTIVNDLINDIKFIKLENMGNTVIMFANTGLKEKSFTPPFSINSSWYNYMTNELVTISSTKIILNPGEYKILSSKPIIIN